MVNVAKYFHVLEELKLGQETESDANAQLEHNLKILLKYIKDKPQQIRQQLIECFHLPATATCNHNGDDEYDEKTNCILLFEHLLFQIVDNTDFNSDAKEDLISTRHMNLCIEAVQFLSIYALRQQIHPLFCKTGIYATTTSQNVRNYEMLQLSIEFYTRVLHIKQFHVANNMEDVLRDYMTAIYTLRLASLRQEFSLSQEAWANMQQKLNTIWLDISKVHYMRNILMLKGIRDLPMEMQKQFHMALMQKLQSKNGFNTLVATLVMAQQQQPSAKQQQEQRLFEVVAQIVAHRTHSCNFQNAMLQQIFEFLKSCQRTEAMLSSMGAGLLSLRRLYDLNADNQSHVQQILTAQMKPLVQPTDLLSGMILMEHNEFCDLISLWFELFCTSMVECLPSAVLIDYLPLLFQLYYDLPPAFKLQRQQLTGLITRCLDNREPKVLADIIERLYTQNFEATWHRLHPRVLVKPNATHTEFNVQVASSDFKAEFSLAVALPELLMSAEHNVLTFRIFMILLQLWHIHAEEAEVDDASINSHLDLLHSEEDLLSFLNAKYPVKVDILLSLNTLISHQPLKAQIAEHATDFLKFLRDVITKRVAQGANDATCDQILLILLTLTQELLVHAQLPAERFTSDFQPLLQQLQKHNHYELVQQQIATLQALLNGDVNSSSTSNANANANRAPFEMARELIESSESHLQVYGMQQMLTLLRQRDATTLASTHIIIALALNALKSPESYTFLNCVRLFVALVHVVEAQVLELLADEYLCETAKMDYRLIVGEALLKVCKELGPLAYKYKGTLLNAYMTGARSPHNEFRMSAFANLAQLCHTLCYQVQQFFEELLHLIDCELTTGAYIPSKRAAVLVLSELLAGMDNLLDFGDMLLPIYKLLKVLEAMPPGGDEGIRTHATNGLKVLNEKCRALLFPAAEMQLHKELKVLGIKESTTTTTARKPLKSHVLDLNLTS